MEWVNLISSSIDKNWWLDNAMLVVLFIFSFVQWVLIQGLLLHYYFFRRDLKRPRPDGIRLSIAERNIAMHSEQLDRIYGKMSELNRDMDKAADRALTIARAPRSGSQTASGASYEATYTSLGEVALKKRLQEMKSDETANA